MKRIGLLLILVGAGFFLITGCKKDDESPSKLSEKDMEINTFIWQYMSYFYLWNTDVPKLSVTYFQNDTNKLNGFLNQYTDHEKLFNDLLYSGDKFSYIVDDYTVLENDLQGISKSMGYNFWFGRIGTSDNLFGYVWYVLKGSPADAAGIKRGNLFTKVNDQQITVSNYYDLLFKSDSYKLSFVDIANNTLTPNGKTANLTAVQITEDPVFLDTVYTINSRKIGYLVYNQFIPSYDSELNNVMLDFKNKGVTDLILDLRYNPGGVETSAVNLASMIYGTKTNEVFFKKQYNVNLQPQVPAEELISHFSTNIGTTDKPGPGINSLNLQDVYIITSNHTASASELVITGLKTHMKVHLIGETTVGKYVGSWTLKDYMDQNWTLVNPAHKWAMQLIVVKVTNSNGETDYVNGFAPDVALSESVDNMGVLGDTHEPLLAKAISQITGVQKKSATVMAVPFEFGKFTDVRDIPGKVSGLYMPVSKKVLNAMKK